MDWEEIVSQIGDRQAALVVDRSRRVCFVNEAMQGLLGWETDELLGRGWMAACVLPRDRPAVQQVLSDGLSGSLEQAQVPLVARDGRRLTVEATLSRHSSGRERALVVVARGVRESEDPPVATWDCSCEVSRAPDTLGLIQSLRFLDAARDPSVFVGKPFGALLTELGCTAVDRAMNTLLDPQFADLVHVALPDGGRVLSVVTASAIDERAVRVTVRTIDAVLLPSIVEAKARGIADRRGLSDRERQVLQLLLRGRGLDEIATMLEIAPRTVKFHQANVLQKLGAESRIDLLRIVL